MTMGTVFINLYNHKCTKAIRRKRDRLLNLSTQSKLGFFTWGLMLFQKGPNSWHSPMGQANLFKRKNEQPIMISPSSFITRNIFKYTQIKIKLSINAWMGE